MTTPDPLSDLRTELGGVDRELLALVARRQALASAIGELKHRLGRPTRDYAQEREVLERARQAPRATASCSRWWRGGRRSPPRSASSSTAWDGRRGTTRRSARCWSGPARHLALL